MTTSARPFPMTRLDSHSGSPPHNYTSTSPTGILTPCLSSKSSPRRVRSRAHSLSNPSAGHHGVRWADELPDVRLALVNVFVERDLEREDWERLGLGTGEGDRVPDEADDEWWIGVAKRWRALVIEETKAKVEQVRQDDDEEATLESSAPPQIQQHPTSTPAIATDAESWPGRVIYHDEHESPTSPNLSLPSSPSSSFAESTSPLRSLHRSSPQHLSRTSPYSPMWAPPSLATRIPPPPTTTSRSASGISSLASSPQSQLRPQLHGLCDSSERDLLDEAITRALSTYCRPGRYRRVSAAQPSDAPTRRRSFSRQRGHRRSISWDDTAASTTAAPASSKPRSSILSAVLNLASGGKPMGFVATDGSWIHPVDRDAEDGDADIEVGEGEAGLAAKARDGILAALEWAIEWPVNVIEMLGGEEDAKALLVPTVVRQPRAERKPIVRKATPAASLESLSGYASDDSMSTPSSSDDERLWEDDAEDATASAARGSGQVTPIEEEKSFWRKRSVTDLVDYLNEKDGEVSAKAKDTRSRKINDSGLGSWSFTEVL